MSTNTDRESKRGGYARPGRRARSAVRGAVGAGAPIRIWLFALAIVLSAAGASHLLYFRSDLRRLTFYDNGVWRRESVARVKELVAGVALDPRYKLGPGWHQSPGYAARYFTMNLLGVTDQRQDTWYQTAAGSGNAVTDAATGKNLGFYIGSLAPDASHATATVELQTRGKAYAIALRRYWPGGPWLVVRVVEVRPIHQTP